MNCAEARLQIGANPGATTPALTQHLRGCEACRTYEREMIALEGNIRRALGVAAVSVAPHAEPLPALAQTRRFSVRHWALAAGLLAGVGVAALFLIVRPADALAAEVVAHVALEPQSWSSSAPVPSSTLDAVLHSAGITLDPAARDVVYARSCEFRGRQVPHLVVQTPGEPVTVLVLAGERVAFRRHFSENGFTGVLLPAEHGSVAVLAQGETQVDDAARLVMQALGWETAGGAIGR